MCIFHAITFQVTHWQHPQFHAYFAANNSYPAMCADILSGAIGCIGFSWVEYYRTASARSHGYTWRYHDMIMTSLPGKV